MPNGPPTDLTQLNLDLLPFPVSFRSLIPNLKLNPLYE